MLRDSIIFQIVQNCFQVLNLHQLRSNQIPNNSNSTLQTMQNKQTKILESPSKAMIGDYEAAPGYMKDNQHITHGYRINFNSPKKILKSLFMMHNQSVNIWSHCVPAFIICVVIFSLAFIVDRSHLSSDLNKYQQELTKSFDHYINALDNLTIFEQMKNMRDKTQIQLQQLRINSLMSFSKFTDLMNENMGHLKSTLQNSVHDMQQSVKQNIQINLQKFQSMKNDYEQNIAPSLIHQFNSFNNSYINNIKNQIVSIKQSIDSDQFKYIDFHSNSPNPQHVSRWPLLVFLFSAFVCLMCSTLFHLFYPMSSKSYTIFSRFDYAGISILIAGSTFPPLYYSMYCYLEVALVYNVIIMSFAIGIFILSVFEWMHRPENAKWKAAIYGGFGLFNIIPISHLLINDFFFDSGDKYEFTSSLPYYLLLGMSYLLGLYIYTIRCPQRHYPGKFNLCGNSHQIWHMFVVLGVIFTYLGAMQNFEMRKSNACQVQSF